MNEINFNSLPSLNLPIKVVLKPPDCPPLTGRLSLMKIETTKPSKWMF